MHGHLPSSKGLSAGEFAVLAAINLLWGLNVVAVKMAVLAASPFAAGFLRLVVVALVCLPGLKIVPGRMGALLLLGLLNGTAFMVFVNLSLKISDNVSALAVAGQLGVPFALVLAIVVLKERIHLPRLIGIVLAFGGVVVLTLDPEVAREVPGLILTALGAFTWAVGSLIQRKLAGVPVITIFAWTGAIGAVGMVPVAMVLEPGALATIPALQLRDFAWIAASAIGSTVLGHGGIAWLLQRHPVTTVAPLTLAAPVVAVVGASIVFDTVLTPVVLSGAIMAISGVAIISLRSSARTAEES